MKAAIIGASGYVGGELLRLLLSHPEIEVTQATSESYSGKFVHKVHPNLRKQTNLQFSSIKDLKEADIIFSALPHGKAMHKAKDLLEKAPKLIDLSADFRIKDPKVFEEWYGEKHTCPELLEETAYGIVELHREEMKKARIISGAGCNATAAILALYPFAKNNLIELDKIIVDGKTGSSEGGNKFSLASHHPERTHCVRSYKPTGHRHIAEMEQELSFHGNPTVSFSPHAIDLVRGILSTSHVFLKQEMTDKDVWQVLRKEYGEEPFIRIVKEASGIYRFPEPKILAGTNYCDIGFELDSRSNRLVVISAIDNLMKGASGQAVHAMNVMLGFDEKAGLGFSGLHPV